MMCTRKRYIGYVIIEMCTRKQDFGYISLGRVPENGIWGTYPEYDTSNN